MTDEDGDETIIHIVSIDGDRMELYISSWYDGYEPAMFYRVD